LWEGKNLEFSTNQICGRLKRKCIQASVSALSGTKLGLTDVFDAFFFKIEPTIDEEDELERLTRENRELKDENNALKAALLEITKLASKFSN